MGNVLIAAVLLLTQAGAYALRLNLYQSLFAGLAAAAAAVLMALGLSRQGIAAGSPEPDKTSEGNELSDRLFQLAEDLGFDSQDLLWLTKETMKTFKDLVEISYEIDRYSEQNAASSEEINASVNELAETSADLNEKVLQMEKDSEKSVDLLAKNQKTMGEIQVFIGHLGVLVEAAEENNTELENSSGKIHEIVDYIRKISSQTNLLALNAAIEAARAGQAEALQWWPARSENSRNRQRKPSLSLRRSSDRSS